MLLSSHLLDRVQSVCDRVALFSAGNIVLLGTVAELGRQVLGGGFNVEVEAIGTGLSERLRTIPGVGKVEEYPLTHGVEPQGDELDARQRILIGAVQRLDATQQRLVTRQVESLVEAFREGDVSGVPGANASASWCKWTRRCMIGWKDVARAWC